MRKDLPELALYARSKGMRAVISTNGTLIDKKWLRSWRTSAFPMSGFHLTAWGKQTINSGAWKGAFDAALNGMRNCLAEGVKVGLRFTINKKNVRDIPAIFDLLEKEKIPRVCFYHLVYAGRGSNWSSRNSRMRKAGRPLDIIMDRTKALHDKGFPIEVLTVWQSLWWALCLFPLTERRSKRAAEVYETPADEPGQLNRHWHWLRILDGSVHADQFWRHYSFGNVKERKFSEIWTDTTTSSWQDWRTAAVN